MSTSEYNKQMAFAKCETPPVAASTAEISTSSACAPQDLNPIEYNPPKARIGKGRPFTPSQKWQTADGVATCIVAPGFVASVDEADLRIVDGHRWYILTRGKNHYAATGQGFLMHRMVAGTGKGDPRRVDHHDCNGLNCRRNNLRITDQSGNMANRRKHSSTTTSKYKGPTRSGGKWRCYCGPRKNRKYLGTFDTEEAAARAYDAEAPKLYGEFARLNFPQAEQGRAAA